MSHTTALQAVEVYTNGTKAWFTDEEQAWVSATCTMNEITDDSVKLVFQGDANQKVMLDECSRMELPSDFGCMFHMVQEKT